jgi:hypothetical protein
LIPYGNYNATSFVDQNRTAFNGAIFTAFASDGAGSTYLSFSHFAGNTRRTFFGSTSMRNLTSVSNYAGAGSAITHLAYSAIGNVNAATNNTLVGPSVNRIWLPTAHVNTNSGLAADHTPVFTSMLASPYLPALPSDFGIAPYYASNAIAVQDTLVVTAAAEEWEMMSVGNNANADAARIVLLARVVG